MKPPLEQLQAQAEQVVARTLASLPPLVRRQAAPLPVTYEARPDQALLPEGYEPDLLGLFIGPPMAHPDDSPLPPQIILFLQNLWDFAEEDAGIYRDEVRITYLHELGHYLGWDETDLEEHGLE